MASLQAKKAGYEQQEGPQQADGFVARTKALMNLPSTSGAILSTSSASPLNNCRASSTVYTRVGSISTFVNPAAFTLLT